MKKVQLASVFLAVLAMCGVSFGQQEIQPPNSQQLPPGAGFDGSGTSVPVTSQIGDSPQVQPNQQAALPVSPNTGGPPIHHGPPEFTETAVISPPVFEPPVVAPPSFEANHPGTAPRSAFVVPRPGESIIGKVSWLSPRPLAGRDACTGTGCKTVPEAFPPIAVCNCQSTTPQGCAGCQNNCAGCQDNLARTGCDAGAAQCDACDAAPGSCGPGCAQGTFERNRSATGCDCGGCGISCDGCNSKRRILDINLFAGSSCDSSGCGCGNSGCQGGGVHCGVSLGTRLRALGSLGSMRQCSTNRIIAGGGIALVRPYWETNPAFYVGNGVTPATSSIQRVVNFDWNLEVSPFVWVGFQNRNGTEFRASYWYFDADEDVALAVGPTENVVSARPLDLSGSAGPGSDVFAGQFLEFQVFDLEARRANRLGCWTLTYGGGLRYLTIDQGYFILANDPAAGPSGLASLHGFDGLGPTFHLDFQRPIGQRYWSTFGSLRQSVLLGDRGSRVVGVNNQAQLAIRDEFNKGVVSMTAIEGGIRREAEFGYLGTFFEFAGGAQFWTGVGNAANGGAFTLQRDQSLGLVGFRVSAGLSF